jgi:hypothetical protein
MLAPITGSCLIPVLTETPIFSAQPANVLPIRFPVVYIPLISSWIAAIRFMRDPSGSVREAMAQSKNGVVRIATLQGEFILVMDRHKVAEYLRAPDTVLNAQDGSNDVSENNRRTEKGALSKPSVRRG